MSIALHVEDGDLRRLAARMERFADAGVESLLDAVGAETETQTRRRIEEEKTGPDGKAWPDWSQGYASSREGRHSLLVGEGDLLDSIARSADGEEAVEVGSPLVYAAVMHFGQPKGASGTGKYKTRNATFPIPWGDIPSRPYLGWSAENEEDIGAAVDNWLDAELQI